MLSKLFAITSFITHQHTQGEAMQSIQSSFDIKKSSSKKLQINLFHDSLCHSSLGIIKAPHYKKQHSTTKHYKLLGLLIYNFCKENNAKFIAIKGSYNKLDSKVYFIVSIPTHKEELLYNEILRLGEMIQAKQVLFIPRQNFYIDSIKDLRNKTKIITHTLKPISKTPTTQQDLSNTLAMMKKNIESLFKPHFTLHTFHIETYLLFNTMEYLTQDIKTHSSGGTYSEAMINAARKYLIEKIVAQNTTLKIDSQSFIDIDNTNRLCANVTDTYQKAECVRLMKRYLETSYEWLDFGMNLNALS